MSGTRQSGFSLIEVIAVLVLLGILAAGLALGLPPYVQSYLNIARGAAASLDVEVAVYRALAELQAIESITAAGGSSISYDADFGSGAESSTLSLTGTTLNIRTGATTAKLLEDVSAFTVTLCTMSDGTLSTGASTTDATLIEVALTVTPSGMASRNYTLRVAPASLQD